MGKFEQIPVPIGTQSGLLTVVEDLGMMVKPGTKYKKHYVKCICGCEDHPEVIVEAYAVTHNKTLSCGCYGRQQRLMSLEKENEYHVWNDIVFVKFSNVDEYFICDLDDWEKLKHITWYKKKNAGYAINRTGGKTIYMHRMIMDCPDDLRVDHRIPVRGGICDNRKSNLRIVTSSQNNQNRGLSPRNTSGYKGVSYHKKAKKWRASIGCNGTDFALGLYDDKIDAAKAYDSAVEKLHGEFGLKNITIKGGNL